MKLLSFNIGIKIDNSIAVSQFINSNKIDIVLLQESLRHFDSNVFDMFRSESDIKNSI